MCEIGNAGSGPTNASELACRPSWSARSLPSIPVCPGTQVKQTGRFPASSFSSSSHSLINLDVILGLCRALMSDKLSEHYTYTLYIQPNLMFSVQRLRVRGLLK